MNLRIVLGALALATSAAAQQPLPARPAPVPLPPGQYGDRQSGYWGDPGEGYFGNPGRGEFRRYNFRRDQEGMAPRLPAQPVKPAEAPYVVLDRPVEEAPQ